MTHPRQTASRRLRTFALLAALTALMGIGAAACGSDDDAKSGTDDTEQAEDGAKDGEATDEGAATDEKATDETATDEEEADEDA